MMQARISNPAMIVPDARQALQALGKALGTSAANSNVPKQTIGLVYLRASQIMYAASALTCTHAMPRKQAKQTNGFSQSPPGGRRLISAMPNAPRWRSPSPSRGLAIERTRYRTRSGTRLPGITTSPRWRP